MKDEDGRIRNPYRELTGILPRTAQSIQDGIGEWMAVMHHPESMDSEALMKFAETLKLVYAEPVDTRE